MSPVSKWIFVKAWPVFSLVPIIVLHFLLLNTECFNSEYLCYNNSEINELISLLMQLTGGLLILVSIDSNIGLFKNNSLFGLITAWYKQRPWKKAEEPKHVSASGSITLPPIQASARGHKVPTTLEERIELLETKVNWLNDDIKKNKKETNEKLQSLDSTLSQNNSAHSRQISNLKSDLIQSSVGGVKLQVFGVLLVFYSSVLSYFT